MNDLRTAYDAARETDRREPSPAHKIAVKAAWTALDEASPRLKRGGYASRAGQRQHAESRAIWRDR